MSNLPCIEVWVWMSNHTLCFMHKQLVIQLCYHIWSQSINKTPLAWSALITVGIGQMIIALILVSHTPVLNHTKFGNLCFWTSMGALIQKASTWWRHLMETFSALLAICAVNSPVPDEFPTQRPVTRRFDVYFDLRPNKRLSKQSWGWWFETQSRPLWRPRNANDQVSMLICMYIYI